MVRRKRNWHPKGYYHIIMRGNNRQNIFNGEQDVKEYYRILNFVFDKYPFRYLHTALCPIISIC